MIIFCFCRKFLHAMPLSIGNKKQICAYHHLYNQPRSLTWCLFCISYSRNDSKNGAQVIIFCLCGDFMVNMTSCHPFPSTNPIRITPSWLLDGSVAISYTLCRSLAYMSPAGNCIYYSPDWEIPSRPKTRYVYIPYIPAAKNSSRFFHQ